MKFEIYQDKKFEWRWRLKARNGKIVATGESYKRQTSAIKTVEKIIGSLSRSGKSTTIIVKSPRALTKKELAKTRKAMNKMYK